MHRKPENNNDILYPAKKKILTGTRPASMFPKSTHNNNTWAYEREFDKLNKLISVRS